MDPNLPITFKTDRQRREWNDPRVPLVLRTMAVYLAWLIYVETGETSVITEVDRSEAERRAIYAGRPEADKQGLHELWRAFDLVPESRYLSPQVAHEIERKMNAAFPYSGSARFSSCRWHDVQGFHFHNQTGPNEPVYSPARAIV